MYLDKDQEAALRDFVSAEVRQISDVDPDGFANYVTALLSHEKPLNELEQQCRVDMQIFLTDKTNDFVDNLFRELEAKYVPKPAQTSVVKSEVTVPANSRRGGNHRLASQDEDSEDEDDRERSWKHERRGRDRDRDYGRDYGRNDRDYDPRKRRSPEPEPRRYSNEPIQVAPSNMVLPLPNPGHFYDVPVPPRQFDGRYQDNSKRPRHNDVRPILQPPGSIPVYTSNSHGAWDGPSTFVPEWVPPPYVLPMPPIMMRPPMDIRHDGPIIDIGSQWNSNGPAIMIPPPSSGLPQQHQGQQGHSISTYSSATGPVHHNNNNNRENRGGRSGRGRGGDRRDDSKRPHPNGHHDADVNVEEYDPEAASITPSKEARLDTTTQENTSSADGGGGEQVSAEANRPRARPQQGSRGRSWMPKTSWIEVSRIPSEFLSIDKLNEHFKKFGNIVNIKINVALRSASIQYAHVAMAKAAVSSPDVIFDNRFVKVFYKDEPADDQPSSSDGGSATTTSTAPVSTTATAPTNPTPSITTPGSRVWTARPPATPTVIVSKEQKERELLKAKLELQRQKEQLLQKNISHQKELIDMLEKKSKVLTADQRKQALETIQKLSEAIQATRVQLSDGSTNAAELIPSQRSKAAAATGAWPRPAASPATARVPMKLDNRPGRLLITGIPNDFATEEKLRQHFEVFGEVETVNLQPKGVALVHFKSRQAAQMAKIQGNTMGSTIVQIRLVEFGGNIGRRGTGDESSSSSQKESTTNNKNTNSNEKASSAASHIDATPKVPANDEADEDMVDFAYDLDDEVSATAT